MIRKAVFVLCLYACSHSSTPPASGSSGAFGIVTIKGQQKLYLPLGNTVTGGSIAVVDVGRAGNGASGAPALIKTIALGAGPQPYSTAGDDTVVIAASTASPTVWFIDPRTDTVTKTLTLDNRGTSSFTSGGGYVTGVAVDSAHKRAVLSVWNGFAIVDLATQTIARTIVAPPSENFGYDSVRERILAPFYDCTSAADVNGNPLSICNDYRAGNNTVMTDGLNVIDLKDDAIYTFQDPAAPNPSQPLGAEPDSAASDPLTGTIVVPSELASDSKIIDLSKAVFDRTKHSVTAPHRSLAADLTGVAVEPGHHLAFWEAEGLNEIAVAQLGNDATLTRAQLPAAPGGTTWSNLGDPHGIAVATGIAGGKPVGFVVNDARTWVARVDLQALLALQHAGTLGPGETAPAVTMLDATHSP